MLRIVQSSAAEGAKSYYGTADYYTEGQELEGVWRGKGAGLLGLEGTVGKAEWDALCDNRNPATGRTLTARQKQNRRVGYDVNFHVPKSLSLLYGLTGDERILDAFRSSVRETMEEMETEVQARVRADGKDEDRTTGNMVWGEFVHTTARPVGGVPDPHLHAHCFVFNATWDAEEDRWKAGQFAGIKRDAPYFEAAFHSRLARHMEELGLAVERTRKGWELEGVSPKVIRTFSRRTALIEAKAEREGIADPDRKGELGAKTRERKQAGLTMDELRREWRSRLAEADADALDKLAERVGGPALPEDGRAAGEAVTLAMSHCFERSSVVPERKLLAEALKRSYGKAGPDTVALGLAARDLLRGVKEGVHLVTTDQVLAEERRMLDFARAGRGACAPLAEGTHAFKRDWLNEGQRRAVEHVLHARDRVVLIRGAAGVGKTSMMQEAVEAIEAAGRKVFAFAPSADASRGVLRQEGFASADTVARLLLDERLQAQARGQVMWIDEAGQLGSRTMAQLFDLAGRLGARVILSGDRRQHGSVERGAALRLLEDEAGVVPAEIKEIQRQKGAYKDAVRALSECRTAAGFRQLDALGWVREAAPAERYRLLAADYAATLKEGKTALVVSPTHLEGEWITDEIRARLADQGRLTSGERPVLTFTSANLTEAERADPVNYSVGDVVVFHQNAKGFRKGERVAVGERELPLDQAARFQLFRAGEIAVAPGELLRITRNGTTADGKHRLNNGALVTVKGFDRKGDIVLANGWKVARDYGHLAYGYVVTSHASQGKTVDRVFIGQSARSFAASSREQFYVSASRGRQQAVVYTDDKQALMEAVSRSDERMTATELVREKLSRETALAIQRGAENEPEKELTPSLELADHA